MALNFGLGMGRSQSRSAEQGSSFSLGESESASDALATSDASSFDTADSSSLSSSFGEGSSYGETRSGSSVFGAEIFQRLFGNASNAAAGVAGMAGDLSGAANGLFDSGITFLSELQDLAGAGSTGGGETYLEGRVGGSGDALLEQQIEGVQADLSQFFGETVLPGIRRDAIGAGGFGGDRQGIAEGIAGRGITAEFAKAVTSLRSSDQAQRDAAASTLAGVQATRRLGAASSGAAALPGMLGLLEGGSMLALAPYLALSEILGDPAILSESFGFDGSSEESGSLGSSVSASRGGSSSTSRSSSATRSASRDIGGSQYSGHSDASSRNFSSSFGIGS